MPQSSLFDTFAKDFISCRMADRAAAPVTVTVADVLKLRSAGLTASETWSLLYQATQALQDLFLSNCVLLEEMVPKITASNLLVTPRGRVTLTTSDTGSGEQCDEFLAPEYRPGQQVACEAILEKMLIFSLGKSLQQAVGGAEYEQGKLKSVLESMVRPNPATRASLMDLLDVISEYCKDRDENRPFSYFMANLYKEVLDTRPQCLPAKGNVIQPDTIMGSAQRRANSIPKDYQRRFSGEDSPRKIRKSCSLNMKTEGPLSRYPVQRAPSRLYRATVTASREVDPRSKYCCPNTCIGPEFIVKATKPSKEIRIAGVKATCSKKVIVMLLNGEKITVACDPNTITAGQIFEIVVISERLEDNFTLGLAALLGGNFSFLPNEIKLRKVSPAGWCGDPKKHTIPSYVFTLYLRVKFFMPSLRGVRNWMMKHLLYLQLRRSLLEQQIQCDIEQHIALSGLALQSEFGDYSDQEHGHGDYFLMEHYIPESLLIQHDDEEALKKRMQILHKERHSLDPGRAEEIYIATVQTLKGYGSHFYNAVWETKDGKNHEVLLAINAQGLTLYVSHGNERHLHDFFTWKRIQLLSYNKQYLFLMPQYDNKGNSKPNKYKLRTDHKKSVFMFHLASFHHQMSMKLRSSVNSLQSLTAEFGVSIKHHLGKENRLYHVENSEDSESYRQQHVFNIPVVTHSSCGKHILKTVCHKDVTRQTESNANIADVLHLSECPEVSQTDIEEHQNKENENPAAPIKQDVNSCNLYTVTARNEQGKAVNPDNRVEAPHHVPSTVLRNTANDFKSACFPHQIRVRMGTKSLINVTKERHSSYLKPCVTASIPVLDTSKQPSFEDAYVLNSSIKSAEEKFEVDFQETLSESLLEKFDTLSYEEERILRIVKIRRDKNGNLGIEIRAGSAGGLYVQSVVQYGPAAALGTVHRGDQLIAMDGHSLLNLKYEEAMNLFQSSGEEVEILLSQIKNEDNKFQLPVRHELDCGEMSFNPVVHPEISCVKALEDSYLKNCQYKMATDVLSVGGESELLSTPMKSVQQLQY